MSRASHFNTQSTKQINLIKTINLSFCNTEWYIGPNFSSVLSLSSQLAFCRLVRKGTFFKEQGQTKYTDEERIGLFRFPYYITSHNSLHYWCSNFFSPWRYYYLGGFIFQYLEQQISQFYFQDLKASWTRLYSNIGVSFLSVYIRIYFYLTCETSLL